MKIKKQVFNFASESVGIGHPDKFCDLISDTLLLKGLQQNKNGRYAIETFATNNKIIVGGEATPKIEDAQKTIYKQCKLVYGADSNFKEIKVLDFIHRQSREINKLVDKNDDLCAGDQGLMFGYANDEKQTHNMPIPIFLARTILYDLIGKEKLTKNIELLKDNKSQVILLFSDKKPVLKKVILALQYKAEKSYDLDKEKKLIIMAVDRFLRKKFSNTIEFEKIEFVINFYKKGGFLADAGLTGRKIIVDTYGGWCSHGGGAFSGKDPTKVDRSGAYYARYVAKNVVLQGYAKECEIQVSYVIGQPNPTSIYIDTKEGFAKPKHEIEKFVSDNFDFSVANIIKELNLKKFDYSKIYKFGSHFGNPDFPWEKLKLVN